MTKMHESVIPQTQRQPGRPIKAPHWRGATFVHDSPPPRPSVAVAAASSVHCGSREICPPLVRHALRSPHSVSPCRGRALRPLPRTPSPPPASAGEPKRRRAVAPWRRGGGVFRQPRRLAWAGRTCSPSACGAVSRRFAAVFAPQAPGQIFWPKGVAFVRRLRDSHTMRSARFVSHISAQNLEPLTRRARACRRAPTERIRRKIRFSRNDVVTANAAGGFASQRGGGRCKPRERYPFKLAEIARNLGKKHTIMLFAGGSSSATSS